jgi:hypothetical protein
MRMKSVSQMIYEAFTNGEITKDQMQAQIAHRIADTLHEHVPREYPKAMPALEQYIEARFDYRILKNIKLSSDNGYWLRSFRQVKDQNTIDFELLVWAKELCKKANSIQHAQKIHKMIVAHYNNPYPQELYKKALSVQFMDSEEKKRN